MKVYYPILILMGVWAGVVLSGCATEPNRSAAIKSAVAHRDNKNRGANGSSDEIESADNSGNPESLAHYAAGVTYEWNDEDEKAVAQFAASANADPSNERLVLKVAERYLKEQRPNKAIDLLRKSARRPEASALLLSWLARADLQAGKTNQALAASRLSIRRQPDSFDGYESEIEIFFHNGQSTEAARALNRAAKSLRPDPQSLVALGGLYAIYLKMAPRDTVTKTNAIVFLDRVAKMKLPSSRLWQTLADTYSQIGELQKAAAIYLRLLSDTPEPSVVRDALHEKLAGIYFQLEDKTNATRELQAIVHDNPTRYPRAWYFLGELAFGDDNLGEASDDYENAIHWDPNFEEAWYKLVLVQIEMHHTDEAFKTLDVARAHFPKTFLCESYTGIAYLHVKNYPEAIRHFNMAEVIGLATAPSQLDYRFYFQFGEACERNQEYKQAAEYLQKCIDLSPDFGEALNYLGYMLADRGEQLPRARALIEKAVHLEPKNGAYLDSLGWVLFKQNQPQQALTWLLKAREYSPEPDATVFDHLGEVYMALHQPGKALEAWKKSFSIEANPGVKKKLDIFSGGV